MTSLLRNKTFLAVSLLLVAAVGFWALRGSSARRPNVIVILLDTLRADHLGVYGHERDTTPNIDKFARENLLFKHAHTAAPWTPPSVATIFTGLYSSAHTMMPPNGREAARDALKKLPQGLFTMAELLKAKGYSTAAVSPNPWISDEFGYSQGFDSFTYTNRSAANRVNEVGLREIRKMKASGGPFFAYLHYLDPHDPYTPPAGYAFEGTLKRASYSQRAMDAMNRYDGEIKYLDEQIGKLFEDLEAEGLYESSLIVMIGDHGEQFQERGNMGHGFQLYNEETRVPLIVKLPGRDGPREIDSTVSTVDVLPTVLQVIGERAPDYLHGISLIDAEALSRRRGVMTEIKRKYLQRGYINAQGKKLIVGGSAEGIDDTNVLGNVIGIFDSRAESIEQTKIEDRGLLRELQSELIDVVQIAANSKIEGETDAATVTDSTIEQLKSLGYLQ